MKNISNDETVKMTIHKECPYEREKNTWFDSKLLKIIGIVYGIATPLITWIVVSIFSLQSDLTLTKQKLEMFSEIRQDIKNITVNISDIKIDIATLKANAGKP